MTQKANERRECGFLRETQKAAKEANEIDGVSRTGLDEYLRRDIFPDVEWIHDRPIKEVFDGKKQMIRPDYRNVEKKLIIEFDGIQHYTQPNKIAKDIANTRIYQGLGYKVVRIPYFIQLTNMAVKTLFGVDAEAPLFDGNIPSFEEQGWCNPAYLCAVGLERMAAEFQFFKDQYVVNLNALKKWSKEDSCGDLKFGANILERAFEWTLNNPSSLSKWPWLEGLEMA